VKLVVLAVLALAGASSAWTAVGRQAATQTNGVAPAYSPSGGQIAFANLGGSTTGGSWGIFVVNVDGSGLRQVAGGSLYAPHSITWSPDGRTIAFDAYVGDGPTSVYTVPVGGGSPTAVTTGWAPAWSPSNKLLVTDESEGQFGRDVRLYSVNPNGSGRTAMACPEDQQDMACGDGDADFSHDGSKIAFDINLFGGAFAVATENADGSNRLILTQFNPPSTTPIWSPDGKSIVYVRRDPAGDLSKDTLVLINADGSGAKDLVPNARQPSWSPDGKTIVYSSGTGNDAGLFLVNADGSNPRPFTGGGAAATTTTTTGTGGGVSCVVPKVAGKPLATARKLLAKAHCRTGKVTRVKSAKVAKGRVVSSKPKAGASKPSGTAVALSVSRGKK
jgi:TolB protein